MRETDVTDEEAAKKEDSSEVINARVQAIIDKGYQDGVEDIQAYVFEKTAGDVSQPITPIETALETTLGSEYLVDTQIGDSIYRNAGSFEGVIRQGGFEIPIHPYGPIMGDLTLALGLNIGGEAIGVDKVGHFFQHGYKMKDMSVENAQLTSVKEERGGYGHEVSGVYSSADIAANMSGRKFYDDLAANYNAYRASGGQWGGEI